MTPPPSPLRLDIDGEALVANWQLMNRLSGGTDGQARAGAAVKANAYGLGARRVVPLLHKAGCEAFFVAHWQEAAELLDLVPASKIAVLHGPSTDAEAAYARACGVVPVINSPVQARAWLAAGGGPCHLMVDTGMSRLGLARSDWGDEAIAALEIDTLISHLASADEDTPQNAAQLAVWREARQALAHRRASFANSAGIVLGADYRADYTRPGLALYGGVPRAEIAGQIRQVAYPRVRILQRRQVEAGAHMGYNATFTAPSPMQIAVVALGYADGYLRGWSNRGVLRGPAGEALPVLGRVSMDLTIIDVAAAPHLREGDCVSVDYSLPEAAVQSGLSQYELLTTLGQRFAREG